ncbi:hypothetical protein LJB42_001140 [Komagataella kurtzmanii]|nr:hypothetical protein LJB42_001140 [Komagataella kurtzmanii]
MFQVIRRFATSVSNVADIVIIGGGPAGLTLGTALKNSPVTKHLKIHLVEGGKIIEPLTSFLETPPPNYLNRVVSLTPSTIGFLDSIGAWSHFNQERTQSYDDIVTYDGVSGARMNFEHPDIATMVETTNIQAGLLSRLNELNSQQEVKLVIQEDTKVTSIAKDSITQWPTLKLSNGDSLTCRLLVGCDGYNSPVRHFAGIESRGWSYNRWGVVATLKFADTEFRFPTGWQRFLPTGPLALLPLPNGYTSMVWSTTPELAEMLLSLEETEFLSMVNAGTRLSTEELSMIYDLAKSKSPDLLEQIQWRLNLFADKLKPADEENFPLQVSGIVTGSRARFPLKLSHADTYVEDRVVLVGDAAHTTHPLAGQGLNMGQEDVKFLVGALERATSRGLDIGNSLALEPYFSERWPQNHVLLGVVDKIHKIHSTDFAPLVAARSFGVDVLNSLGPIKDFMVRKISGSSKR